MPPPPTSAGTAGQQQTPPFLPLALLVSLLCVQVSGPYVPKTHPAQLEPTIRLLLGLDSQPPPAPSAGHGGAALAASATSGEYSPTLSVMAAGLAHQVAHLTQISKEEGAEDEAVPAPAPPPPAHQKQQPPVGQGDGGASGQAPPPAGALPVLDSVPREGRVARTC